MFWLFKICRSRGCWSLDINMTDYQTMYHIMLTAAANAIEALERGEVGKAWETLIVAERKAEAVYMETAEGGG